MVCPHPLRRSRGRKLMATPAKAQARHRAKRKAYIEQVMSMNLSVYI